MTQYCTVETVTDFVVGVRSSQPAATASHFYVPVSDAQAAQIAGNLLLPQGGGPAWRHSAGNIIEREDERPIVLIDLDKAEVQPLESVQITLTVVDKDLNPINITQRKKVALVRDDAGSLTTTILNVQVTNGSRVFNRSFQHTGIYRLSRLPESPYRLAGENELTVVEDV